MSYLVLARKSRPQTFEEVVGQKSIVKTLQNSLKRSRVAHAILFSGVRGVGKTTLARLMAKALNCESGPTPVPCNACNSCTQITSGSSLDLYEIDGASNRGIQEVRELKEKIKFLPTSSTYKIVIIDEVHMLTTEAFNALLKTLEEPPEHVHFMFATTELHKIPITILSRCQRYELQRVSSSELSDHFQRLAESEGIKLERSALSLIVREAEGSVRDGLSLLDQVFSYGESPIGASDVVEVLGLVSRDVLTNITRALLSGDKTKALENLSETFQFGMDIKRFMADLLDCFRTLLLIKIEGCEKLLDFAEDDIATFTSIADSYSVETIHLKLKLLIQTAEDIRHSLQPRLALETSFLSIIEAGNVIGVSTLLEKLDDILQKLPDAEESPAPSPEKPQDPSPHDSTQKKIAESAKIPKNLTPTARLQTDTGAPESEAPPWDLEDIPPPEDEKVLTSSPSIEQDARKPAALQKPDISPPSEELHAHQREIRKDWIDFISYVRQRKEWMSQNLQQADSVKEQGKELLLEFENPTECTLLRSIENRKTLTEYVLDFFQKEYTIHFITPNGQSDPGMDASEGPKKQRQKLASNPLVRMTEEIFGGHHGDIRIGPLSR